ncbi:MAG: PEGA domain-containing protein [Candidatus Marinimicrobia bacterium]|nr:PEGA domain-containing protein [Candidatus Neomarinimicrobiota bacterium]
MNKLFFVSLLILLLVGCAYIIDKDVQDIGINSTPTGAKVVITTTGGVIMFEGTTPASANLKKKYEYIVTVSMEGYQDKTMRLDQAINPIVIGNLLCGGIPGLIVDAMTGALYKLEPDQLVFTLQTASINGESEKLYVFVSWLNESGETVSIPIEMEKE